MVRSKSGKILVVDNDVLVYIFQNLYADQSLIARIVRFLNLTYGRIWIPGEVKNEFLIKRKDKKTREDHQPGF